MWPFRKKPPRVFTPGSPFIDVPPGTVIEVTHINGRPAAQKEKMMKLEIGKWYETEEGIFQAASHRGTTLIEIGALLFDEDRRCYGHTSSVLREVPAPLRLEVGKLYALEGGKVAWCEAVSHPNLFGVGDWLYNPDGSCGYAGAPKILHRIKLNERVVSALSLSGMVDFARDRCGVQEALMGRASPMPVTYKPHTDCDHREPIVPDGWERVPTGSIRTTDMRMPGEDGFWRGVPYALTPFCPVIRPKSAPFRITWPGWYRQRNGSWVKMVDKDFPSYRMSGEARCGAGGPYDLIARATPEQARILDAL